MASSFVQIANSALIKVGADTITSFADGTTESNVVNARYEECRDIVLRMHPWNCAVTRVVLAALVTVPAYDFSTEYQLPADCLRVLDVEGDVEYRIEGRKLLADSTPINLKYIRRITDPNELDVLCAEAIAFYLAYDISYKLMQSGDHRNAIYEGFLKVLRQAKTSDAQEDGLSTLEASYFLRSRLSTGNPPINR